MKPKYVEERFPLYFEFGRRVDGLVEISTADDLTVAAVAEGHAEKLVNDRNELVKFIADMADAFDKADSAAFKRFWYSQ